jgi:hypothetical protein
MSSEGNYQFNVKMKSGKKIENEPFLSIKSIFDIHHIQVLLNMSLFLALKELVVFVADYLGVGSGQLVQALKTYETTDGRVGQQLPVSI